MYLLWFILHFYLPGRVVADLCGLQTLPVLLPVALSYAVLVLILTAGRLLGCWDVGGALLIAIGALAAIGVLRRLRRPLHGPARGGRRWQRRLVMGGGAVGLAAGLAAYAGWAGPYLEVPADAFEHLRRVQQQLPFVDAGGVQPPSAWADYLRQGADWYWLQAWLCRLSGLTVAASVPWLNLATTLTLGLGVYAFSWRVFVRLRVAWPRPLAMALLATLFFLLHQGVSVFAYLRYYALAPAMLNFVVYLAALALFLNYIEARPEGRRTVWLLPVLLFVLATIHTQEAAFAVVMMALSAGIVWFQARRAGNGATDGRRIRRQRAGAVALLVGLALLAAYVWWPACRESQNHAYAAWTWSVQTGLPGVERIALLDPRRGVSGAIAVWGVFVYGLFIRYRSRLSRHPFLLAGMAAPLATVFNPLAVDLALRFSGSAITSLYRFAFVVPLAWVAAFACVEAVRPSSLRPVHAEASRGRVRSWLWAAFVLVGSILFLLPVRWRGEALWTSRWATLRPTPECNSARWWGDLVGYLNTLPPQRILTDPVTGYLLNGLTPHRINGDRFTTVYDKLYVWEPAADVDQVFRDVLAEREADWLLVINRRDGGPSETGRRSGHWPEEVLRLGQYYPPELDAYVAAHADLFVSLWETNAIRVLAINIPAVIAQLPTTPKLLTAKPALFEGPGMRVDWTDAQARDFVAYQLQVSDDGIAWRNLCERPYRHSWFNHQGAATDTHGNWRYCLPSDHPYYYRVRAVYRTGPAPWSNVITGKSRKY